MKTKKNSLKHNDKKEKNGKYDIAQPWLFKWYYVFISMKFLKIKGPYSDFT